MSENQEQAPVEQTQQPVAASVDYSAQVELLKAKNQELIGEKRKVSQTVEDLQKQITELQQNSQKQKQAKLAESGEFKSLWEDATKTVASKDQRIAELESQLQEREAAYQQQTIQARAVSAFQQAGVQ